MQRCLRAGGPTQCRPELHCRPPWQATLTKLRAHPAPLHRRYLRAVAESKRGGPAGDQACVAPYEDQVLLHSEACILVGSAAGAP